MGRVVVMLFFESPITEIYLHLIGSDCVLCRPITGPEAASWHYLGMFWKLKGWRGALSDTNLGASLKKRAVELFPTAVFQDRTISINRK